MGKDTRTYRTLNIKVTNPDYETYYVADNASLHAWNIFLSNHRRGKETVFFFSERSTGATITLNPSNFASCEAWEETVEVEMKKVVGLSTTHEGKVGNCPKCGEFVSYYKNRRYHKDINCLQELDWSGGE